MDSSNEWEALLSERDRATIIGAGYGRQQGLGARPALLVIDAQEDYFGPRSTASEGIPGVAIGPASWEAARRLTPILETCRLAGWPVIYTVNVPLTSRVDLFGGKRSQRLDVSDRSPADRIVDTLKPLADEPILAKSAASAFFGTPLDTHLHVNSVDSLVVAGVSTSGCVRATVVDAAARGFRVTVLRDCVADRISASHRVALLDMWMKYADLTDSGALLALMSDTKEGADAPA